MTGKQGSSPESIVREIKRQTRRKFGAEEKIRIVLEGLRGEARFVYAALGHQEMEMGVKVDPLAKGLIKQETAKAVVISRTATSLL